MGAFRCLKSRLSFSICTRLWCRTPEGSGATASSQSLRRQGLNATPEQLWQSWHESEEQFRLRRTDPGLPFQTYFDAWADGFRLAFETMGLPGDADAATSRFFADLSRREPFPETPEALRELQAGYRIAVLSNADDGFLLPNLELLDFEFETVLSSEMARSYKPQPELFQGNAAAPVFGARSHGVRGRPSL